MQKIDLTGQRFGTWTALHAALTRASYWTCRCDCGAEADVFLGSLRGGRSTNCVRCQARKFSESGQARQNATKHGFHKTSEYCSWRQMKKRCLDPKTANYADYGGRGITVCAHWQDSFENFLADMGPKPTPRHTLDRKDVNGNYELSNCRWATVREQNRNKRGSRWWVNVNGKRMRLLDALDLFGNIVGYGTAQGRLMRDWNTERALTEPPRQYGKNNAHVTATVLPSKASNGSE